MREPHTVPLSRQAVELLKKLHAVTGTGEYLFPNRSNLHKPVSRGVLWKAVASMGYLGALLAAWHQGDRLNDPERAGVPPRCDRKATGARRAEQGACRVITKRNIWKSVGP